MYCNNFGHRASGIGHWALGIGHLNCIFRTYIKNRQSLSPYPFLPSPTLLFPAGFLESIANSR
ncbi:hypothetical protein C7B69_16940 [filamentous cyanobacterium Phorm 46]|nr:hypothetical protein C7B69_16940 [filamentous cyanobacterium Phorm 46]PSB51954.1 hypothetical protein C7B67_08960 [filamentous cyanobacterium Phorm 6]